MAFAIPTCYDPLKMMETFASLPEEQQKKVMDEAMDKMDEAQQASSQEGKVKRFKAMRATFVHDGGPFAAQLQSGMLGPDMVQTSFTMSSDTKPRTGIRPLRSLKPMIGDELDIGTTHRGRYLCGWVAVDDAFFGISSSTILIVDVTGFLVEIGAYGLVDAHLPPRERQYRVATQFPKGKPIVVIEPYYKVRMDGTEGIRVDKPQEIVTWTDVPTDLASWKQLGNKFSSVLNTTNGGRGAMACYQRALQSVQPHIHEIAMLLTNIATCKFKMGDYLIAIQLAGAAVHLEPTYFKGWFRLAASLAESEGKTQCSKDWDLLMRVVAHARMVMPSLSLQELEMLGSLLPSTGYSSATPGHASFSSYAEWCAELKSPGFMLGHSQLPRSMDTSVETKSPSTWRKAGSASFVKGDIREAKECYWNGLEASASYCRDVSVVLNNIAAVQLTLHEEMSDVPGITISTISNSSTMDDNVPRTEAALLNCTVAGIIDPLNHKAWSRRARCLRRIGFTTENCIAHLRTICDSVTAKALSLTESAEKMQVFKRGIDTEMQRLSQQSAHDKSVHHVSEEPTEVQRVKRDSGDPSTLMFSVTKGEMADDENLPFDMLHREEEETIDQYIARVESFVTTTRLAFGTLSSKSNRQKKEFPREMTMFLNDHPPQTHIEFPKLRGWPDGIDPIFARKVLYRAYLDANLNPWILALALRDGLYFTKTDPADIVKRWHGTGVLKVIAAKDTLNFGDIVDGREAESGCVPVYDARIRSNFANNPTRAEIYFLGTTHVAIGFNDFSGLLTAKIRDKAGTGAPLKFVGFDMSEFAVAKCKVVAQMLKSPDISISSVMEVWLSSTWSETTLADFRKSVNAVLTSLQEPNKNCKVVSYLRFWVSAATISAAKARSEFFSNLERYNSKILSALSCFRREIDRLDLCQYMLTGEIRASATVMDLVEMERDCSVTPEANRMAPVTETKKKKTNKKKKSNQKRTSRRTTAAAPPPSATPLVGSLTMWNVPPGAPPLKEDIAFSTVSFLSIVEDYTERKQKQASTAEKLSVVDLFVIHILQNLRRLRGLMLSGKLTIDIEYGVVKAVRGETTNDPVNKELLARISTMRPYTISWSNVLDYFMPEDFHDLARRCSIHGDCVHYGYSMNWPTQVLGASIMDFDFKHNRQLIDHVLDAALGFPNSSKTLSVSNLLTLMGMDKLVTFPFHENPLNSTGCVLAYIFHDKWIAHFLSKGRLSPEVAERLGSLCTPVNCGLQKGSMELSIPSPLDHTSTTLHMSWTYDPELRMHRENAPVETSAEMDVLSGLLYSMGVTERQRFLDAMTADSSS